MITNHPLWKTTLCLVMLGLALGCSDNHPVSYSNPDYSTFCNNRAVAECNKDVIEACQTSEATCVESRRNNCLKEQVSNAIYQPAYAEKCIDAAKTAYKDAKFTVEDRTLIEQECFLLWGGPGKKGDRCERDYDCEVSAKLRCVKPSPDAPNGECHEPVVNESERCNEPWLACSADRFCKNGDCIKKRSEGDKCSDAEPCADGLMCVPKDENSSVCKSKFAVGSECKNDSQCLSGFCLQAGPKTTCAKEGLMSPNEPTCRTFQ